MKINVMNAGRESPAYLQLMSTTERVIIHPTWVMLAMKFKIEHYERDQPQQGRSLSPIEE
jgi:hypothetical protein